MQDLLKIDFGSEFILPKEGYVKQVRYYMNSYFMWMTEPLAVWEAGEEAPYMDYAWQYKGEFRLGLKKGHYKFRFLFCSGNEERSEFQVRLEKTDAYTPTYSGNILHTFVVKTGRKQKAEYNVELDFDGGVFAVVFPEPFFINALEVACEEGGLFSMYPEASSGKLPNISELMAAEKTNEKEMLGRYCAYFAENKTDKGFIGDYWTSISEDPEKIANGTHEGNNMLWYTASYVVRTLLMGYKFHGKQEWLDEAIALTDKFVSEQLNDGSFTQIYRQEPTVDLTEERLAEINTTWRNLADVGSMVAALVTAAGYADTERKEKYLASAEKYFLQWALQYREPSGGFRNGWTGGPSKLIYGVSTSSTALAMALFAVLTGKNEYMKYAEEAALFLAKDWNEDGRYLHWPYDNEYPGHAYYQDTTFFADSFYILEAVSGVLALSSDKAVRKTLFEGLEKFLFGSVGLLNKKENASWWPVQCTWHNSKSAGVPVFLMDYLIYGEEFGASQERMETVKKELEICIRFLCEEEYANRIGVLIKEPQGNYPFATNRVQSWRGCAMAATGFAGLALSQILEPGAVYLKKL